MIKKKVIFTIALLIVFFSISNQTKTVYGQDIYNPNTGKYTSYDGKSQASAINLGYISIDSITDTRLLHKEAFISNRWYEFNCPKGYKYVITATPSNSRYYFNMQLKAGTVFESKYGRGISIDYESNGSTVFIQIVSQGDTYACDITLNIKYVGQTETNIVKETTKQEAVTTKQEAVTTKSTTNSIQETEKCTKKVNSTPVTKPIAKSVIKLSKVTGIKVKNIKKKKIEVSWKWKEYSDCSAYGWQVQYAQKRSFKGAKIKNTRAESESLTIKKCSKNKMYYIRVRVWIKDYDGIKRYGKWSGVKRVKIKK